MNEEIYEKLTKPIRKYKYGTRMINLADKIFSLIVYLTYPIFLLILILKSDIRFWKVLFIPGLSFVVVSLFRKYVNLQRPYEILDIDPLIHKETKGKSFPSRHVFSAFIIAMTIYYISKTLGIILMVVGIIIAGIRVVGGVHFPRDVIVGAISAIILGIVGWNLFIW